MNGPTTPVPTTQPLSPFLWETHKYTNEYIRFADTKAAFIFTAASAVAGALVASGVFDGLYKQSASTWKCEVWLAAVSVLLLSSSIVFAVSTVWPRLWGRAHVGAIFWEAIRRHPTPEAYFRFLQGPGLDKDLALTEQIYVLAGIAQRKYDLVKRSIILGLLGGGMAAFTVLSHHMGM